MPSNDQLRKKYHFLRKKKYFEVSMSYFKPLKSLLNSLSKKKKIYLSFYYPSNFEVNTLKLLKEVSLKRNVISLLPAISGKNNMKFYRWNFLDSLKVNKYGMLEPFETKKNFVPDIILVPLLAFDNSNHRLGYGKGYYDKFLNEYLSINHKILSIGVAFSFQKYNKLPTSKFDFKLNHVLTEKGMRNTL